MHKCGCVCWALRVVLSARQGTPARRHQAEGRRPSCAGRAREYSCAERVGPPSEVPLARRKQLGSV